MLNTPETLFLFFLSLSSFLRPLDKIEYRYVYIKACYNIQGDIVLLLLSLCLIRTALPVLSARPPPSKYPLYNKVVPKMTEKPSATDAKTALTVPAPLVGFSASAPPVGLSGVVTAVGESSVAEEDDSGYCARAEISLTVGSALSSSVNSEGMSVGEVVGGAMVMVKKPERAELEAVGDTEALAVEEALTVEGAAEAALVEVGEVAGADEGFPPAAGQSVVTNPPSRSFLNRLLGDTNACLQERMTSCWWALRASMQSSLHVFFA